LAAKGRGSALVNVLVVTELLPSIDLLETDFGKINGWDNLLEADFWTGITSGLPVIRSESQIGGIFDPSNHPNL
jgi:hypothetical protein